MNKTNNRDQESFERIEAYLAGSLGPDERIKLENEMKTNPELAGELSIQRELLLSVEVGSMKDELERIHREVTESQRPSRRYWYAIAAGLALLIASTIWFQMQPSQHEKLFLAYTTTDPGLPVPMSASAANSYSFYDAMVDYKAEKYTLAIEKWKVMYDAQPQNDTLRYYIGSAWYNNASFTEAIPYFEETMRDEKSEFRYKAQWYFTLSYLKLGNESAIQTVEPLKDSPYTGQIEAIQNELH